VIYVIQSSDPAPEPHPTTEPQPHTPEPHTPEPHTPEPHAPEPPPSSEPQPHAPEPHPQPPAPTPQPIPPTPTVDDFYVEELAKANNFEGVYGGAVALTGNNDTISIFGGMLGNGSVPDFVLRYTIGGAFSNVSYWNPSLSVKSYSQAPPDPSNNYVTNPLYYLVENMTEYSVWSYDGTNFQKAFNISFKPGEVGQQIAALPGGVYVYGAESGLWWWDANGLVHLNVSGPEGRMWPALVAYKGDLFLQGGNSTTKVYEDFWYYSQAAKIWSPRNSTGIPASAGHTATLSVLKTDNIYFTGLSTGAIVNYDINANSSSTIMGPSNLPSRTVATISGNRMFVYGGKVGETTSNSLYQIVNEKYCTGIPDCETCVSMMGCTFCKSAVSASAPSCVSGTSTNPYILRTCSGTNSTTSAVISMVEYCPEIFPSWAIALIVIGGVILVGGIVFGIMKLRSGKPGYEPV